MLPMEADQTELVIFMVKFGLFVDPNKDILARV